MATFQKCCPCKPIDHQQRLAVPLCVISQTDIANLDMPDFGLSLGEGRRADPGAKQDDEKEKAMGIHWWGAGTPELDKTRARY